MTEESRETGLKMNYENQENFFTETFQKSLEKWFFNDFLKPSITTVSIGHCNLCLKMTISNIINLWDCSSVKFDPLDSVISSLYYKTITFGNDDSSIVNKLETSVIEDARVVIYDCHMFIVQAIL